MSITDIQEDIIKEFSSLEGWMEKYDLLVKTGRTGPPMPPDLRTDDNLIKGCQVRAWFQADFRDGKIWYDIDSDSLVIRGLAALLVRVFSGRKPEEVVAADPYFIDRIGLSENLMPTDPSNLQKIVERIKQEATNCIEN